MKKLLILFLILFGIEAQSQDATKEIDSFFTELLSNRKEAKKATLKLVHKYEDNCLKQRKQKGIILYHYKIGDKECKIDTIPYTMNFKKYECGEITYMRFENYYEVQLPTLEGFKKWLEK